MRFYNRPHTYYCGIDLHVKTMYVCILDGAGQVLVHRNVPSTPEAFLEIVGPYRDGLVEPRQDRARRRSSGVGIHPHIGMETCAGNEDGTERGRGHSEAISYGRASS